MGGNLLHKFDLPPKRLSLKEYVFLKDSLLALLNKSICSFGKIAVAPHVREKQSFGDIDILIGSDNLILKEFVTEYNLPDFIFKVFNYKPHSNDKTYSFPYCGFQVDIKVVPLSDFNSYLNYCSWGDCGNLMGTIFKRLNLSLGTIGLFKKVDTDKIVITQDFETICEVGGFNHFIWKKGFDSQEKLFQFIYSSKYFDTSIFQFNNLNSENRSRNSQRTMYVDFVNWINAQPVKTFDFKTGEEYLKEHCKKFPKLETEIQNIQAKKQELARLKGRFNGNLASEWSGIKGKELGDLLKLFYTKYKIEELTDDEIKEKFLELI